MFINMKESVFFKEHISVLQELIDNARCKNELELQNIYKGKLNIILRSPIIVNDPVILYRSRLASEVNTDITLPATFSYVPLSYNAKGIPKRGRMNLSGQSLFYASSSPDTNYREIKKNVMAGDEVFLSQWEISPNSGFSIYNVVSADNISESVDKETRICITEQHIVNNPIGDYLKYLSNIILMKEDNPEREYLASSLISNKILIETIGESYKGEDDIEIPFHYDAIAYPSTQIGNGEANRYNWVITPRFIDDYASLKYVVKGTIKEDLQSVDFKSIGFNHNGTIEWYEPYIYIDDVIYEPIGFINKEEVLFSIENVTARNRDGSVVDKNKLTDSLKNEENLIKEAIENGIFSQALTCGEITDEKSLIKEDSFSFIIDVEGIIGIEGLKLEKENVIYDIEAIGINAVYKTGYKKIENIDSILSTSSK